MRFASRVLEGKECLEREPSARIWHPIKSEASGKTSSNSEFDAGMGPVLKHNKTKVGYVFRILASHRAIHNWFAGGKLRGQVLPLLGKIQSIWPLFWTRSCLKQLSGGNPPNRDPKLDPSLPITVVFWITWLPRKPRKGYLHREQTF